MLRTAGARLAQWSPFNGRVVCALGLLGCLTLGAIGAIWFAARPDIPGWLAFVGFALSLAGSALLGQIIFDIEGWLEQSGRGQ